MKHKTFVSLRIGERFEYDDEIWRKLGDSETLDNAQMLRLRLTRQFAADALVAPMYVPRASRWRIWLLARSLRWHFAGFPRWAGWSWRLSRLFASDETHQALAAHTTTLMMLGD